MRTLVTLAASVLALFTASCNDSSGIPVPPRGFSSATFEQILASDDFTDYATTAGRRIYGQFGSGCSGCHDQEKADAPIVKTLKGELLWGSDPESRFTTIKFGVRVCDESGRPRSGTKGLDEEGRVPAAMPSFTHQLGTDERHALVDYVAKVLLRGEAVPADAASAGRSLFSDKCAACHGPAGEGILRKGYPRLDRTTRWSRDGEIATPEAFVERMLDWGAWTHGMPRFTEELPDWQIRCVTLYVLRILRGS